jgi:predicted ArsR family transcriptional regulator
MSMEGLTLTEMAKKLGIPQRTVERRIQRAGIKPLSREAIYPSDTLDIIKDVKMGRPKKQPESKAKTKKK